MHLVSRFFSTSASGLGTRLPVSRQEPQTPRTALEIPADFLKAVERTHSTAVEHGGGMAQSARKLFGRCDGSFLTPQAVSVEFVFYTISV